VVDVVVAFGRPTIPVCRVPVRKELNQNLTEWRSARGRRPDPLGC